MSKTPKNMQKNMFCNHADLHTEASVESLLVTPLIKAIGYKDSQIRFKPEITPEKIAIGSTVTKYRPDYILYFDGKPRVVVDAKAPGENLSKWVEQVSSYAITLNQTFKGINPVRYMMLSNGENTWVFDWTEGKPLLDVQFDELQKNHPKYKRLLTLLDPKSTVEDPPHQEPQHRFERKSIEDVNLIFARCHQYIYTSDNMSQAAGFTEFVKLVFLKLLSDRRVRDASGDLIWQERFEVPESNVIFSTRWIKDREADTPNPIDAIQFQKLVKDIEVGIKNGTRKRIFDENDRIKLGDYPLEAGKRKIR